MRTWDSAGMATRTGRRERQRLPNRATCVPRGHVLLATRGATRRASAASPVATQHNLLVGANWRASRRSTFLVLTQPGTTSCYVAYLAGSLPLRFLSPLLVRRILGAAMPQSQALSSKLADGLTGDQRGGHLPRRLLGTARVSKLGACVLSGGGSVRGCAVASSRLQVAVLASVGAGLIALPAASVVALRAPRARTTTCVASCRAAQPPPYRYAQFRFERGTVPASRL